MTTATVTATTTKPRQATKDGLRVENMMRIHGRWYDVTEFNHPGGPVAIGLGKGRDATALFEAHHPFTSRAKLGQLLKKYEVPNPPEECERALVDPREKEHETFKWGSDFTEPRSAFARQVQEEVADYFRKEAKRRGISLLAATKATPWRWFEFMIIMVAFVATFPFFVQGYW